LPGAFVRGVATWCAVAAVAAASMNDIAWAVLETSGKVSIIPRHAGR
jgi:hypothetical protein